MDKWELDTPALLVDYEIMKDNLQRMQQKADMAAVRLRPHTKTHRTPALARLQVAAGANGITVSKLGEAEVMAANGLHDIFIANQIVGKIKWERLRRLAGIARLTIAVDHPAQVVGLQEMMAAEPFPLDVLIEIEVGEKRTGVVSSQDLLSVAQHIAAVPGLRLQGVYSHEGHTYAAGSEDECRRLFQQSQQTTLAAAACLREAGFAVDVVSVGATPSLLLGEVLPGITEVRPGTYLLMDAAQANIINTYEHCAASILATVVSKPAADRVVLDAGVKALTAFTRDAGICRTEGYGVIKGFDSAYICKLYDEHGLIENRQVADRLDVGDKVEVILIIFVLPAISMIRYF